MSLIDKVTKLKHSCVKITDEAVYYFDPFMIDDATNDADYIFITHGHHDHYSLEDIKKVMKESTVFVAPESILAQMKADGFANVKSVLPGDMLSLDKVGVEVIPSYNQNKDFHPQESNWVGYIVRFDEGSYYVPGDTDATPEFISAGADVYFVPVGGKYTMNVEEAIAAVNLAAPQYAIPFHYASLEGIGGEECGEAFVNGLLPSIKGVIL